VTQEEKQFLKKCLKKRKNTILLKYEMKVLSMNTIIHIAIMFQKTWALFACKGTKCELKSCCNPSKSLGISNDEKL
jgi:hypothetical protein